eukprot:TRINITY_DN12048_c1_g2_i1.p1 TRINITY_DN12048_c1_g2~~TRINITY_DN12048_c1_g2_i1.p1  ORF type:complete len:141 (+),score=2.66 TRINITY_DN12048_c1_g2_i1:150-572(+)
MWVERAYIKLTDMLSHGKNPLIAIPLEMEGDRVVTLHFDSKIQELRLVCKIAEMGNPKYRNGMRITKLFALGVNHQHHIKALYRFNSDWVIGETMFEIKEIRTMKLEQHNMPYTCWKLRYLMQKLGLPARKDILDIRSAI